MEARAGPGDALVSAEPDALARLLLQREVEEFLYQEAELLDARRFDEWLALFTDDARYWMPMRRNVPHDDREREFTREGADVNCSRGQDTLGRRVAQIQTGIHWGREPPRASATWSRTSSTACIACGSAAPSEVTVRSRFLVYRNRVETETDILVASARTCCAGWMVVDDRPRMVVLDQSVLLAKNLTFFI